MVWLRVSRWSTSTRFPPEKGERSSGSTAPSVPRSKISPEAFLATSMAKIPSTVIANQPQEIPPSRAAAQAPRNREANEAREILGSASLQRPDQKAAILSPWARLLLGRQLDPQRLSKSRAQPAPQILQPLGPAAVQQHGLSVVENQPQGRDRVALGGGGACHGKTAVDLIDAEPEGRYFVIAQIQCSLAKDAALAERDPPFLVVEENAPAQGYEKRRDAEQDQIHHREIPEGSGRPREAALTDGFDNRH